MPSALTPKAHHKTILDLIRISSGTPTQHTFNDNYLGTKSPRYPVSNPQLRMLAREWMRDNRSLTAPQLAAVLGELSKGKSSTEKMLVGILLDYATADQKKFSPSLFEEWLGELCGWAEIDTACTGKYSRSEVTANFTQWKKILTRLSKSKNINLRRASLALLVAPVRKKCEPEVVETAFAIIDRLKHEKEILITKAISWLLRSMIKQNRKEVMAYLEKNTATLPAIAVRETRIKLETGRKK